VSACVDDAYSSIRSNTLQLNTTKTTTKTEVLWFESGSSAAPDSRRPVDGRIGSRSACPFSPWYRYLPWFWLIDADARHTDCVQLFRGFATDPLHQTVTLVLRLLPLVLSRDVSTIIDCSTYHEALLDDSATLAGLPTRLLDRLQMVLNAAARLVYGSRKYDHVTPLLHLHWLRVPERITFRLVIVRLDMWSNRNTDSEFFVAAKRTFCTSMQAQQG